MGKYKVEISGINTNDLEVLSNEKMRELFILYHEGHQECKDILVNGNLRLVLAIIQRFNKERYNLDDLFQIGCVGLIKAVDNFDVSYNCLFSTYAVPLILGEIKRYIRDNTAIRISRGIKDNAYRILKYKEEYMRTNNQEPSWEDIAKNLEISEYDVKVAMDSLVAPVSIFEPIYNDGGDTIYLCDKIASTKEMNQDRDLLLTLKKALLSLKGREKAVLENRYIIGKTQAEIADILNISQAQVSRIEKSALSSLKRIIK